MAIRLIIDGRIARNASSEKTVPEAGAPGEGAAALKREKQIRRRQNTRTNKTDGNPV